MAGWKCVHEFVEVNILKFESIKEVVRRALKVVSVMIGGGMNAYISAVDSCENGRRI